MGERQRNPLLGAPLPTKCKFSGSAAKRRQAAAKSEMLGRAGGTLATLQCMARGKLSSEIASEFVWGESAGFRGANQASRDVTNRMISAHGRRPLSENRLVGERALGRLVGENSVQKGSSPAGVERRTESAPTQVPPVRGERWPMRTKDLNLPTGIEKAVDVLTFFPSPAMYLSRPKRMLEPEGKRLQAESGITPHSDPLLEDPVERLCLATKLWMCSMLREVDEAKGFVDMFTVVQKVVPKEEDAQGTSEGSCGIEEAAAKVLRPERGKDAATEDDLYKRFEIVLRLIFDHRLGNLGWREPPWTPLAGPTIFGEVVVPPEPLEQHEADAASGDIPAWFYRLKLPAWISPYFVLRGVEASSVRRVLLGMGWEGPLPSDTPGRHLGLQVVPVGWRWAVYIAQIALLGLIRSAVEEPYADRLLIHGTPAPVIEISGTEHMIAVWGYVEGFGVKGLMPKGSRAEDGEVRQVYWRIRERIMEVGFPVHKEKFGVPHVALGTRLLQRDPGGRLRSGLDPSKRDVLVEGTLEVLRRKRVLVDWLSAAMGSWTWGALPNRPCLSIFREVYQIITHTPAGTWITLGEAAELELWGAIHLSVLMEAENTAEYILKMFMFDASPDGGALVARNATPAALLREGRWGGRSGFYTVREQDLVEQSMTEREEARRSASATGRRILRALVIGDQSAERDSLRQALREAGDVQDAEVECETILWDSEPESRLLHPLVRGRLARAIENGSFDLIVAVPKMKTCSRALWH